MSISFVLVKIEGDDSKILYYKSRKRVSIILLVKIEGKDNKKYIFLKK